MRFLQNFLTFLLYLIVFLSGMIIDRAIKFYPLLKLDKQINILDLGTLLATVAVAFMIPLYVTKIIEDTRGVKKMLVDELIELLEIVKEINIVISQSYNRGSFSSQNRDDIIHIFNSMELKVDSITSQTAEAFGERSGSLNRKIKDLVINYQDYITGGELMVSRFVRVEERFYRESNTEYSKIETGIKTLMQAIYKL
jgi:hypothetical protein